jgi:hypothetical protein
MVEVVHFDVIGTATGDYFGQHRHCPRFTHQRRLARPCQMFRSAHTRALRFSRSTHTTRAMSSQPVKVALKGGAILNNPRFNKGSAFTHEERNQFALRGRLPYACVTTARLSAKPHHR